MRVATLTACLGSVFQFSPGLKSKVHGAALGGAAALLAFAPAAQAIVVVSPAANIIVPTTTAGIYINVLSGAAGAAATTTGWDINPWGSAGLSFFNPAAPTGGVYVNSIAGQVASLAVGTVVGPATPLFGSGAATTTAASSPWALNATNYFGFRFLNEGNGAVHYGYGTMNVGATLLQRTVGSLFYESTPNTAITVVPEPSTYALMLLGVLGVVGAAARRSKAA